MGANLQSVVLRPGEKQSSLCAIVYNPCNVRHRLFTNLQLDISTFVQSVQEHSIVLPQGRETKFIANYLYKVNPGEGNLHFN